MADRPKRRSVLRKTAVPDATHYVGYVEDDETPEMIMKKFEEMERIRAAHSSKTSSVAAAVAGSGSADAGHIPAAAQSCAADEGALDQEQLHAIFKATSMYNVKTLLGNNEALMVGNSKEQERGHWSDIGNHSGSEDELVAELRGFWSDDDWAASKKSSRSKRLRGNSSKHAPRMSRALQRNQRTSIITQYNRDTHAFIRRRMRLVDPDAILQLRLPPPPLPLSWGHAIKPFSHRIAEQQQQGTAAAAAVASGAAARGLIHQPPALPASRNSDPVDSSSIPPGAPLPADSCEVHVTTEISSFAFSSLRVQHYQAVLINTGWEVQQQQHQHQHQQQQQQVEEHQQQQHPEHVAAAAAAGVASWSHQRAIAPDSSSSSSPCFERLAALPVLELCPRGFLMIWANKEHLSGVVRLMSRWGYSYVENLTWVLLAPNQSIMRLPSHYIKRSHITLYIFRKDGEGRDIELRHQRNPDVVFDCVRFVEGREWDVPEAVFSTIETLLPTGKGKFLELWAPSSAGRAGWTHIVQQQQHQQ